MNTIKVKLAVISWEEEGAVSVKGHRQGFGDAGNVLFPDLGNGYMGVFAL